MSFFGVEREGTAEGQSKGLCVAHFDCRLCYTVHGSPRVQRERVIYFVNIMNVGFVFGQSRTRMFSLIPPHGPKGRLLFWTYGNRNVKPSAVEVFTLAKRVYKKSCCVKYWSGRLQVMTIT